MTLSSDDFTAALTLVRQAADQLDSSEQCSSALLAMGTALGQRQDDILEANTLDLEISRDMAVPDLVVDWLKLTPERVQTAATVCHRLADVGTGFLFADGAAGSAYYHTRPVGIVGFIYEAFPDLGAIAAALCIRTGNALVLRGGSEASHTNQIIASILCSSLENVGLSPDLILPVASTDISRLDIAKCPDIDLIIPHGRPSLVDQIIRAASVRVVPSRIGNCYLYWDASGSLERVYQMIVDSHSGAPDAVNRIEKVLLHESHDENAVTRLWNRLQEDGFEIRADKSTAQLYSLVTAESSDWSEAYLAKTIAFRQVEDTTAALSWINTYSSGHADSIVTVDYSESRKFVAGCRSASVYINASPLFVRNAKQTGEIALGISDYKGAAGGLIGLSVMRDRQRIFHGS